MRTHMMLGAGLCALFVGSQASADQEPRVQESFISEIATTQQRSGAQVQIVPRVERGQNSAALRSPLEAEFGLTDRLQLQAEADVGFGRNAGVGAMGPLDVGASYGLYKGDQGARIVARADVRMPLGRLDPEESRWGVIPRVLGYLPLGPVDLNADVAIPMPFAAAAVEPASSLTAIWTGTQDFHPLLEVRREWGQSPRDEIVAGVIMPGERMQVGGGLLLARETAGFQPGAMLNLVFNTGVAK